MRRLSAARAIRMRPNSFFGLHRARDISGDQFRLRLCPRSPVGPLTGENMDRQTKREIWLLTIGTIIVEIPVAFAAFTILSH